MGAKPGWERSWALHGDPYFCLNVVLGLEGPEIIHTKAKSEAKQREKGLISGRLGEISVFSGI